MNTPKARQQWIYNLLVKKPTLSYGDCCAEFSLKFAKTKRTFDKDWKTATKKFKEYQKIIEQEKLKASIEAEKEAVKKDILTKQDAMEVLTEIAKSTTNSNTDRIKAISELAKYNGWHAPTKQETTIIQEQPLFENSFGKQQ